MFNVINLIKKNKSIYLEYAMFYFMFSFFLINAIVQFTKPERIFDVTQKTYLIVLLIFVPIYLILSYCGFKVYYKTHKEYTTIYKELQSI